MIVSADKNVKALHIFLFLGLFMMVWGFNADGFRRPIFDEVIILYAVFNFLVVWFNYFLLSKIIFEVGNRFKWIILIISLVLLHYFSLYALTLPLKSMFIKFPDDRFITSYYDNFYIRSFQELFSSKRFAWVSVKLHFYLILFFVVSMTIKYLDSLKKISDLKIINAHQELDMLKSQLQPRFLFNTLNNLHRLVADHSKAGEVVLKLSDLLRFTLYDTNADLIPLKMEIRFLENYIELEKIRHHEHVRISYDFNEIDCKDSPIAPLLFVNFVENAFKHGINKSVGESWVKIRLNQTICNLHFEISNSKPKSKPSVHTTGGHGLNNIRRRLNILYPDRHKLNIYESQDSYTVDLTLDLEFIKR